MSDKTARQEWESYQARELAGVLPILERLGFTVDAVQPHISGERYLMQAVTTTHGKKLTLLGRRKKDGARVIIKATSDPKGAQELNHERTCRTMLRDIRFAYHVFFFPDEFLFAVQEGYTISAQAFLPQERSFLERPLKEQFSFALKAFKAQESAHATTYEHARIVKKTFGSMDAKDYLQKFREFEENIRTHLSEHETVSELLKKGEHLLETHQKDIEQYSGFLTHTDFVPHNFRIRGEDIYLLDQSSLRFGNKYEGWARFCNFMTLYNPELEKALVEYVRNNRNEKESLSLELMRIYRLGEIIWYYTDTLDKTSGDLRTLEEKRITFWAEVLRAILNNAPLEENVRKAYIQTRDALRSAEEKERQVGLH